CDESQAFGFNSGPLAGQIVLAGCGQWSVAVADTWIFNGSAQMWMPGSPLNEARRNQAGALLPNGPSSVMYILGGYGESTGFADPTNTSEMSPAVPGSGSPQRRPPAPAKRVPAT